MGWGLVWACSRRPNLFKEFTGSPAVYNRRSYLEILVLHIKLSQMAESDTDRLFWKKVVANQQGPKRTFLESWQSLGHWRTSFCSSYCTGLDIIFFTLTYCVVWYTFLNSAAIVPLVCDFFSFVRGRKVGDAPEKLFWHLVGTIVHHSIVKSKLQTYAQPAISLARWASTEG